MYWFKSALFLSMIFYSVKIIAISKSSLLHTVFTTSSTCVYLRRYVSGLRNLNSFGVNGLRFLRQPVKDSLRSQRAQLWTERKSLFFASMALTGVKWSGYGLFKGAVVLKDCLGSLIQFCAASPFKSILTIGTGFSLIYLIREHQAIRANQREHTVRFSEIQRTLGGHTDQLGNLTNSSARVEAELSRQREQLIAVLTSQRETQISIDALGSGFLRHENHFFRFASTTRNNFNSIREQLNTHEQNAQERHDELIREIRAIGVNNLIGSQGNRTNKMLMSMSTRLID